MTQNTNKKDLAQLTGATNAFNDIAQLTLELAEVSQCGTTQAVLVAGQALAFWGEYYLHDTKAPADLVWLASRDIDFYEQQKARVYDYVKAYQALLVGSNVAFKAVNYPTMDDATIHTALVELEAPWVEKPIVVDFIGSVDGLSDNEITRHTITISVGEQTFSILNPLACLKARVHNLLYLYPRLGKSEERMATERERVVLAMEIAQCYIADTFKVGYWSHIRQKSHSALQPMASVASQPSIL